MKVALASAIGLSLAAAASVITDIGELPDWSLRLGWVLVHSTWQLSAIAFVALAANIALSRRTANVRYVLSSLALVAMLIVPGVTWSLVTVPVPRVIRTMQPVSKVVSPTPAVAVNPIKTWSSDDGHVPVPEVQPVMAEPSLAPVEPMKTVIVQPIPALAPQIQVVQVPVEVAAKVHLSDRIGRAVKPWLGFIDLFWFVGVLLLSVRPVWGLWTQYRLRSVGLSPVSSELQALSQQLARRMGITAVVRMAVSALVKTPMVVGYLRPIILLPASVVTGLTPRQLELLLAHELAHIRRHDWIVNALQVVVETLLFYHPAVWWLSRRIRHERELCCDDLALTLSPDRAQYGRMLLALEELLHHSSSPALAATGGNLVDRIRRLLPEAKPAPRSFNGWLAGSIVLVAMGLVGGFSILSAQPPAKSDLKKPEKPLEPGKEDNQSREAVAALVTVASHDAEFSDPIIDLRTLTTNSSHWYGSSHVTRLLEDRWLRSRGYGDLTRSEDNVWIGLRGATLVVLDQEDLEQAARLPFKQLQSLLETQGRVQVPENDFGTTRCLAIHTGAGDVYVGKLLRPFPWSLKLDLRRLTTDKEVFLDLPNDGIEAAAWGPVVDGLQAGIVYRVRDPQPKMQLMIGDMISVKLFVRNVSPQEKIYEWQLEEEFSHMDPEEKADRTAPRLPIFRSWRPILRDDQGKLAVVSPPPDHQTYVLNKVTLKPGESVLVGTATTTLWSEVDVDFGTAQDRLNAAEVAPGEYRLSTQIDTRMAGGASLKTGEIVVEVVKSDGLMAKTLMALDDIPFVIHNHFDENYWSDPADRKISKPPEGSQEVNPIGDEFVFVPGPLQTLDDGSENRTKTRPMLNRAPVEYLVLPGLIVDEDTKQPVAGVTVRVDIAAQSEHSIRDLCEYQATTDAEGRYQLRIPRPLLAGYADRYKGVLRIHTSHPDYGTSFDGEDIDTLRTLGLIDKNGAILKQGELPEIKKPAGRNQKDSQQAAIQVISMRTSRTVSGRLVGPNLQPLPNVQIYGHELTGIGFPSALILEKTDAEGRFRFNVPAKTMIYLEFRIGGLPSKEIQVAVDQTDLGDVVAGEGSKISGQVLDAEGKPVAYVTLTAPPVPRNNTSVFTITSDENGRFDSHLLAPGEYQLEVGEVRRPEDERQGGIRISGPPPDLYLPYRFKIEAGVKLPEVTLAPAKSVVITATVVSTSDSGIEKGTDAFDVVFLKNLLQQPIKVSVNGQPQEEVKAPQLEINADANTGKISVKGDPDGQWAFGMSFFCMGSMAPSFKASGMLEDNPWTAQTTMSFPDEPTESTDPDADANAVPEAAKSKPALTPNHVSLKVPRDVKGLVLESIYPLQHVQIGSGPKLFGSSFRIPDEPDGPMDVKMYRYKATTLRIRLIDADGKPIPMVENKLPEGITSTPRFTREEEVKLAGAVVNYGDSNQTVIHDNEIYYFVIPDEEIEITLNVKGQQVRRKFTLKDGETRQAELKLSGAFEWTESSKPTPKVEFEE